MLTEGFHFDFLTEKAWEILFGWFFLRPSLSLSRLVSRARGSLSLSPHADLVHDLIALSGMVVVLLSLANAFVRAGIALNSVLS